MHQLNNSVWPVVRPVPKVVIWAAMGAGFVAGHALLWNDRRQNRTASTVQKTSKISSPARV